MQYKQAREITIFPFIILSDIINIIFNGVLDLSTLEIVYHLLLTTGLGWFIGSLFWAFISGHFLDIALTNLNLDRDDIDLICSVIDRYKLNKDMTYAEFDKIVKDATEVCSNKVAFTKDNLEIFVTAAACFNYKILWYGSYYGGLREVKYLERENYDAVKIIEHVQGNSIRKKYGD